MVKKLLEISLICLLGLIANDVIGQTYPVQATTTLIPPYSPYLADYTQPGSNKLTFNVLLIDPMQSELQVSLRIRIEGQGVLITTSPAYRPAPIILQAGIPEQISGTQLQDYLNPRNLQFQGITKAQFERTGALPEGLYRICFEVIEYNRSVRVSNTGCATAWMILNDPPLINFPALNETVDAQYPQFLRFQWTPRHTGSPNAAFTTQYELKLVEVRPKGANPNVAIQTLNPIFTTTTVSTSLVLGPAEPSLVPGMQYAYQIRAKSISGVDELDLFKNNGYSQVGFFTYGEECLLPENINVEAVNPTQLKATWRPLESQTSFIVRYREKNNSNAHWFEENIFLSSLTLSSLKPGTSYEIQIIGTCGSVPGTASDIYTVTTPGIPTGDDEFSCGSSVDVIQITNKNPISSLSVGSIIKSGDFNIILSSVSGGNGTFSGTGVAAIPWFQLAGFKVAFENIKVNDEKQVYEGLITSLSSKDSRSVITIDTGGEDGEDDGVPDELEDIDGDGDPSNDDTDGDGIPDYMDDDDDGDGVPTSEEDANGDGDPTNDDSDGDGIPDYLDNEDNSDDGNSDDGNGDDNGEGGNNGGGNNGGGNDGGDNGNNDNDNTAENVFGPITVTFVDTPEKESEEDNNCNYNAIGSFNLWLKSNGIDRQVNIEGAEITYTRNCTNNELISAEISWSSNTIVELPEIGFLSVGVKSISLTINNEGQLTGDVTLSAWLNEDVSLSELPGTTLNTPLDIKVKSGLSGDFGFSFAAGPSFDGSWDFAGIENINIELLHGGSVVGQFNNGALNSSGQLQGLVTLSDYDYTSDHYSVSLKDVELDLTLDLPSGIEGWNVNSGNGRAIVSGLQGVQGALEFGLNYQNEIFIGTSSASTLSTFGMEISDAEFTLQLTKNLEFISVSGNFKAKHTDFNTKITVKRFELSTEGLQKFNLTGEVLYEGHSLEFLRSEYNSILNALEIDAVATVDTGGTSATLIVNGFTVFHDGSIEMGDISGEFDSGDLFGPVRVTFESPPQSNEIDSDGYKHYKDIKVSMFLKMQGANGVEKEVNITEANIDYKKHQETDEYKDVVITWEGDLEVGEIGFIGAKLQGLRLQIDGDGKLSGTATLEATLNEDKRLSDYITSIDPAEDLDLIIKQGITGDFSFAFSNSDDFTGSWDFMGISGVRAELMKSGNKVADFQNGEFNSEGILSGVFNISQPVSYQNKYAKITLETLSLGINLDINQGMQSFSIVEGAGLANATEMQGLKGKLTFDLEYMQGVGFKAIASAQKSQISAFGMTLSNLNLGISFDDNFDLLEINGSVKAKHDSFNGKLAIREFKVVEGALTKFNGGGSVDYKGFKFDLERVKYQNEILKVASANMVLELSQKPQSVTVEKFEINNEGDIEIGKIEGSFNKSNLLAIDFMAEFNDNRFKGDFSGSLALIDMSGAMDIGTAEQNGELFNFGYLEIVSDLGVAGVPLGPSGLKLTQLGGQLGINYKLDYSNGNDPVGSPENNHYVAGLTLGVGDIANMMEVVGNPVVQIGENSFELNLNGTLNVPRLKPMFSGDLSVNYKMPANIIQGRVSSEIKIPASSGSIFRSNNLAVDFYVGDNRWSVYGNNMGGSLLNRINFYNGIIDLKSEELSPNRDAPVTGTFGGRVSFADSIIYTQDSWWADVDARIAVSFDSYINIGLTEVGMEGGFGVELIGEGYLKVDSAIDFEVYAYGSASMDVGYYENLWKIRGELILKVESGEHSGEYDFEVDLEL